MVKTRSTSEDWRSTSTSHSKYGKEMVMELKKTKPMELKKTKPMELKKTKPMELKKTKLMELKTKPMELKKTQKVGTITRVGTYCRYLPVPIYLPYRKHWWVPGTDSINIGILVFIV